MTRGRIVWFAMLAVGLSRATLAARVETGAQRRRRTRAACARRERAGSRRRDAEFEVEVADPREVSAPVPPPAPGGEPRPRPSSSGRSQRPLQTEPERALALAEQAERRFGESPRAVERRLFEIKALVKLGRIGKARTKAERYLELTRRDR